MPFWLIVVLAAPFLLLYDDISWYDVMTDSLLFTCKMNGSWWFKLFLVVGLVIVRFATGWNILNIGLIVAMIIILVDVQEYISERVLKVFNFLGKMSMNMWLIHMFFITYGYHLTNPFIDLVWIYLESLVVAYVIWKLYNRLCGCLK